MSESFDEVMERLHDVVTKLEGGNMSLEESLQLFEDGVKLASQGHGILRAAEERVEILVKGKDGKDFIQPFKTEQKGKK